MSHPNILFVFADQLRYSAMACNGNTVVRTPNFDRLAGQGVAFDQAFSSCPICSPYRGQLITGNYSHVNGVVDNEYRLFDDQRTLAHRLAEHGYRSAWIGKWHLGRGPYPPRMRYGFDDLIGQNVDHSYYNWQYYHNEAGPFRVPEYAPRVETRQTLDWIARHRREHPAKPFCAVLSWGPPHWNRGNERGYRNYPQEYNIYDPEKVDVPANVPMSLRHFAAEETADYYGMVTSLDECMGTLMAGLDAMGLAEDTIVCFSSDHGDHLFAHGYGKDGDQWLPETHRMSKATPLEDSIHIPFILRFPARVTGVRRTDVMFNSVDVLPTLMGLAGLPTPGDVQGRDLSFTALGTPGEGPDSVYLQILGPGWPHRKHQVGLWRGVRTGQYTYARWYDRGKIRMLFDRQKDPLELKNVVDDPAYASAAAQMEARLKQWMTETKDPFDTGRRLPETDMLDLGQACASPKAHSWLPKAYAKAIEPNYAKFKTGEPMEFH